MICFLVPIKSKKISSDWQKFSRLVDRGLKSINGQTNRNFQIVVACHELPEPKFEHPQIHYIEVNFAPPTLTNNDWEKDNQLKEGDKAKKILSAYEYAESNFDANYYMVVDADDCIHSGISEYVNNRIESAIPGWYFKKGYFYQEGKKLAFLNRLDFNMYCGTCVIIKKNLLKQLIIEKPYLSFNHRKTMLKDNLSLISYPKPGAVYSMSNGENHYMSKQQISKLTNRPKLSPIALIKRIFAKFSKYKPIYMSNQFKKKYNIYTIS